MNRYFSKIFAILLAMSTPEYAFAGPVVIDGVQYNNEDEARLAIQRSIDIRIAQVPDNYLQSVNVDPIGGRFVVELPTLEEARLKYVWVTGGLFRPGRETQNLVAESVIANLKVRFLTYERARFIDQVIFVENGQDVQDYDYYIRFQTDFDGERSPQAGQFRETNWIVRSRGSGREYVALTAYGAPFNVNDLAAFSSLRNAVDGLMQVQSQRPVPRINGGQEVAREVPVASNSQREATESAIAQTVATSVDDQDRAENQTDGETQEPVSSNGDEILERALSRCLAIGFERGTTEFRDCVTQQINILSR